MLFTCIYLSVIIKMFSRKTWWNEMTNCVKCFSWIAFSISNRQTIDLGYFIERAAVLFVVWHLMFVKIWKTKCMQKTLQGEGRSLVLLDLVARFAIQKTTDRHLRGNGDKFMFDFPSEMNSFENPVLVTIILQSVLEMCTIVISSANVLMMSTWIWLYFGDCVSLEIIVSGLQPVKTK